METLSEMIKRLNISNLSDEECTQVLEKVGFKGVSWKNGDILIDEQDVSFKGEKIGTA